MAGTLLTESQISSVWMYVPLLPPAVQAMPAFVPFGWARPGFAWGTHAIIIGGVPWGRTWANRTAYVHPYANAYRAGPGPRVEDHHAAAYHHPDEHPH